MTEQQGQKDSPWPSLPKALQHLVSLKWMTLEAARILQNRLRSQGRGRQILLLTSAGMIRGTMADISDSYEESVVEQNTDGVDPASAAVHLRTQLWNVYSQTDDDLRPTDSAAIVHVCDATVSTAAGQIYVDHLALFADEVSAFAFVGTDQPSVASLGTH